MVNNADWLRTLNYLEFLREIGRHFSVNRMLAAEAYRTRYDSEGGLNFLEFNYMLLQSYDFLHLYREYGCVLQMAAATSGATFWPGADLIRRVEGVPAFAMTFPLITTNSGAKMGKSERGAIWAGTRGGCRRTTIYQFWIQQREDADVQRFLALFTFPADGAGARAGAADRRRYPPGQAGAGLRGDQDPARGGGSPPGGGRPPASCSAGARPGTPCPRRRSGWPSWPPGIRARRAVPGAPGCASRGARSAA